MVTPGTATTPSQPARRLVRVWPDVARALDVSRSTAFDLCSSGAIRSIRIGRSVRVPVEEVDRFIQRRLRSGAGAPAEQTMCKDAATPAASG